MDPRLTEDELHQAYYDGEEQGVAHAQLRRALTWAIDEVRSHQNDEKWWRPEGLAKFIESKMREMDIAPWEATDAS